MAQPRLLAPPQTSQTSTVPSTLPNNTSSPALKSSSYRPPTSSLKSSGALSNPSFEPKRCSSATLSSPPKKLSSTIPKIEGLRNILPDIPYLISVPWPNGAKNPYNPNRKWEDQRGTPFQDWEWGKLQYMSLVPGDVDRELVKSTGLWVEGVNREDPWRDTAKSGGNTPWNGNEVGSGGSGNNTVGRTGERKKVSFGDYLRKKKDSPNDTPVKRLNGDARKPEVPNVVVNGDGVVAKRSESSKSAESRGEAAIQKPDTPDPYATIQDLPAMYKRVDEKPVVTNGHAPKSQSTQLSQSSSASTPKTASQTQPEKEEGELADEPSLPSSTANILKAPLGKQPTKREPRTFTRSENSVSQLDVGEEGSGGTRVLTADLSSQPSSPLRKPEVSPQKSAQHKKIEEERMPEKGPNKRPLDDSRKTSESGKRQRVEKPNNGPTSAPAPYTGTSRPYQRQPLGNITSKPSTPLPAKPTASSGTNRPREADRSRDGARRKENIDSGSGLKTAMPRLLSPLPDHLASTNGTPMQRTDSRDSRRVRSPHKSTAMQKPDIRDSRRGDRSPPRSTSMAKSESRDSGRDRSRSPLRGHSMQKSGSRDSGRDRSPARDSRRDRSPLRSTQMQKSDSRDSRGGRSPVKKDAPAATPKPRTKMPWERAPAAKAPTSANTPVKTTPAATSVASSRDSSQKKDVPKEDKPRKESIPMPALLSFDLPANVEADMKRRLESGDMSEDAAAAFRKVTGHKREISNVSSMSNGGKDREMREDTPVTERETKKTSTQALRERARKPDTPGVARKAVATKTKAKQEKKVVILKFKRDSEISDQIGWILKGKSESAYSLQDYQGRRGQDMIARRTELLKPNDSISKGSSNSIRPRPSPSNDDEDESPVQRSRKVVGPTTPKDSAGTGGMDERLAAPSVSKLREGDGHANTPGSSQTPTKQEGNPVSPIATRAQPVFNEKLTERQREMVRGMRAEYDRYISLGTSLKRQRDALIRPSPEASGGRSVSEQDAKKANIMGVESLLAYLAGFEAMDRAYKLEGSRNKGAHWKSLFPYLDSFRLGLKSSTSNSEAEQKTRVVLDIVASLVGYSGASCLATLHNNLLEKDGAPNSRDEMLGFIKEQTGNFKRREGMGEMYRKKCLEASERWPEMIKEGRALSWITSPGGQWAGVGEVKGKLSAIVKELCKEEKAEWETKLDF